MGGFGLFGGSGSDPGGTYGVYGQAGSSSGVPLGGMSVGVWGDSSDGYGVKGSSGNGTAVVGNSSGGTGVFGMGGGSEPGVCGYSWSGASIYGWAGAGGGLAGVFNGLVKAQSVQVNGDVAAVNVNKTGSCSFKIDHPLDPENKYLRHSAVESPDLKNIYDGVAVLDANSETVVELPAWFEPLNREFRYQLTPIGAPGPNLYVKEKIRGNRFKIAGGQPGMEVSWQVTGIRHDLCANAHRRPVEEEKPESERGYFLHPELYGLPPEKGVEWARRPQLMRRMKEEQEGRYRSIPSQVLRTPGANQEADTLR